MNLRRMTHVPSQQFKDKVSWATAELVIWDGHVYDIIKTSNTFEAGFDCNNCAAHKDRIKSATYVNGGMCPDNDKTLDWTCYTDNENMILRHRI